MSNRASFGIRVPPSTLRIGRRWTAGRREYSGAGDHHPSDDGPTSLQDRRRAPLWSRVASGHALRETGGTYRVDRIEKPTNGSGLRTWEEDRLTRPNNRGAAITPKIGAQPGSVLVERIEPSIT